MNYDLRFTILKLAALLLACITLHVSSFTAVAAAYDTNSLQSPLVDDAGVSGWPTNGFMNGLTISNYAGSGVTIRIGLAGALQVTNQNTHATFNVTTNGHWSTTDQAGTVFKTATNGVFSVVQTNGNSLVYSNGTFLLNGISLMTATDLAAQGASGTNYANAVGLAGTNNVQAHAIANTNFTAASALGNTNFTLAVGLGNTNNTQAHAQSNTNFTQQIGSEGTNNTQAHAISNTNFTQSIGAAGTNYANAVGLAGTNNTQAHAIANTNFTLQVGLDGTNFTLAIGLANTNYADSLAAGLTNWVNIVSNDLAALLTGGGLSYLIGDDIFLKNLDGTTRLQATQGGAFTLNYEDAVAWLNHDTSHNTFIKDHAGTARIELDDAGGNILRGAGGQNGWTESANGYVALLNAQSTYTDTWPMMTPGVVTNFFADVNNSGTSETAANAFNVPANSMATNGDRLVRCVGVTVSSGASDKRVRLYFGGDTIFDSTALANTGAGAYSITAEVIRTSATDFRYNVSAVATAVATPAFSSVGSATLVSGDFTAAQDFHISLTVTGSGAGSSQATVITDTVIFNPDSTRAVAQ